MVRLLIAVQLLLIGSARGDLRLIPTETEYLIDGARSTELAFPNGNRTATYQPPFRWRYSGSENQLSLYPPGDKQAEARIWKANPNNGGVFDEATCKQLTYDAITNLPSGSAKAEVVSGQKKPIRIGGRETFEVVISYTLIGQPFKRSIIFLNGEHGQLRFQLVAREADFADLQRTFYNSLCTWRNL